MLIFSLIHVASALSIPVVIPSSVAYFLNQDLGNVTLTSSGISKTTPETLIMFELGLKLYHLFSFELARTAFELAAQYDNSFILAYWGQAISFKSPIWHTEDIEKAGLVLAKITQEVMEASTQKEQLLLHAIRTYMDPVNSVFQREEYYVAEMEMISLNFPEDADIGALYGVALLGVASNSAQKDSVDLARHTLTSLNAKFPNHRGIQHYLVHASDTPEFALLAIPIAKQLANSTPSATHANHMLSHLALQVGRWGDVFNSNNAAVFGSETYCFAIGEGYSCDAEYLII